jgi:transcriptional regulator with XRE-family HTH domain
MVTSSTSIGAVLRQARIAKGLSAQAVANDAGCDQSTVTRIETETRRSTRQIVAIAEVLDVPIKLEDVL